MPPLCDSCYAPGACCKGFHLNDGTFADGDTREAAIELIEPTGIPFIPLERGADGRWLWECTKLGPDGRCTIYRSRPQLCKDFAPASDRLCAHWNGAEAGDPTHRLTP